VKSEEPISIASLGRWQKPIVAALQQRLPGAYVKGAPLPTGRAGIVVYWKGFSGRDALERQAIVRSILAGVGADAARRVARIFALTPDEALEMNESL
jgi:hypothetical protein